MTRSLPATIAYALVAGDDRLAAVGSLDVGDEDELVGKPAFILRDGASRLLRMRGRLTLRSGRRPRLEG